MVVAPSLMQFNHFKRHRFYAEYMGSFSTVPLVKLGKLRALQ